ncbi:MAG TPA: DUF2892 domain-containing protein [Alphaproteobacteria bacterium]|nr:DUF2892 domain-containing protein [Alphaproteobacteria bacterium]USO05752.1 MAG: DUF2892 domain-containing protein [Rhodospirillales bacterium]HOO82317.1 DUF2892 domain-containing protein [Alphaproteobacteria bacterium]
MFKFEKNIGDKDKKARIAAAVVLFAASFFISGVVGNVLILLAVVMVVTSFFGFCPAYTFMGMNTCCRDGSCKVEKADDDQASSDDKDA